MTSMAQSFFFHCSLYLFSLDHIDNLWNLFHNQDQSFIHDVLDSILWLVYTTFVMNLSSPSESFHGYSWKILLPAWKVWITESWPLLLCLWSIASKDHTLALEVHPCWVVYWTSRILAHLQSSAYMISSLLGLQSVGNPTWLRMQSLWPEGCMVYSSALVPTPNMAKWYPILCEWFYPGSANDINIHSSGS